MRSNVVLFAFFLVAFAGCEEPDKIYVVSPPAESTPTDVHAPSPSPVSFQEDAHTSSSAIAVEAWPASVGDGPIAGEVWLNPVALWTDLYNNTYDRLTSVDVLLRIDPASNPEVLEVPGFGSWCFASGQPQVTPTATLGNGGSSDRPGSTTARAANQYRIGRALTTWPAST